MVDRPLRLRARSREVDDEAVGRLRQGDALRVEPRRIHAVVLRVVLPRVGPVRDLAQELPLEGLGGPVEDRVDAGLDLRAAVSAEEVGQALRPEPAGRHLAVEVAAQTVGQPRVAHHDLDDVLVRLARRVELHRRDDETFLVRAGRVRRHRARDRAADVVVMPEDLDERDDVALVEHRQRHAEIGKMADPALGAVDVVVEVDVARPHRFDRKVAHHRLHERGVGASGQLAAAPIMDAGPEVARLADHRGARRALDGRLHLRLHGGQRPLDDLEHDGIDGRGAHGLCISSRVSRRFPNRSTSARSPGNTTVVAPYSSTITGPVMTSPGWSRSRAYTAHSTDLPSKRTV